MRQPEDSSFKYVWMTLENRLDFSGKKLHPGNRDDIVLASADHQFAPRVQETKVPGREPAVAQHFVTRPPRRIVGVEDTRSPDLDQTTSLQANVLEAQFVGGQRTANGPWVTVDGHTLRGVMPNMLAHRRDEHTYYRSLLGQIAQSAGLDIELVDIRNLDTVEAMEAAAQADVILAPGFAEGVIDRLVAKRKNTRLLTVPAPQTPPMLALRQMADGFLVQEHHRFAATPDSWAVVTDRRPTDAERADAAFAWRVCGHVSSNAIVLAKDGVAWGIGAGQQNRVESGEIAASKAAGRARGGACASDAFYPFPDGIHAAADAGAAVIVQPGGSVGDDKTIAAANERNVAMVFTGERQFLH